MIIGLQNPGVWTERARCADPKNWPDMGPDSWFSDHHSVTLSEHTDITKAAKRVCSGCPVKTECRLAGRSEEHGIWGGVTPNKRAAERRKAKRVKMVDATGAGRRIQALATLGWAPRDIVVDIRRYTGINVNPKRIEQIRDGEDDRIPQELWECIDRTYRHLRVSASSGNASSSMVARARSEGWVSPRRWRGLDIDNPKEVPNEAL